MGKLCLLNCVIYHVIAGDNCDVWLFSVIINSRCWLGATWMWERADFLPLFLSENAPQAFAISLSQVIANDRTHRQRQEGQRLDPAPREEHKDPSDLVSSILQFATKRPIKELSSSNSSLSSTSETANESTSPNTPEAAPRARRRVREAVLVTFWKKVHSIFV